MNCKFHPTAEAVTTCATCGAGMCASCDKDSFFKEESGQPLCFECSLKEAEENVSSGEKYLKKMKIKLVFATIFVALSILPLFATFGIIFGGGLMSNIIFTIAFTILFWFLAGRILVSRKEKMKDMSDRIGLGIAAPFLLISSFREYSEKKVEQPLNIQKYEKIKAAMGNAS